MRMESGEALRLLEGVCGGLARVVALCAMCGGRRTFSVVIYR